MISSFKDVKDVKSAALDMLRNEAETDVFKALTTFKLLLENPAGIGDHSTGDYYQNLREALDLLCDAEDRLDVLRRHFYRGGDAKSGI